MILNEAHNSPRDRAFALAVAKALRPLGYSILAAEGFASDADPAKLEAMMKMLAADKYPRLKTGFYLRDPVFGDFVRQSLALGYRPVAYEQVGANRALSPLEQISAREQAQAENLVQRIFTRDRQAKVLIYVGYSHVAEAPLEGGMEWMAARLKKMTGVDPLTIDQAAYSDFSISRLDQAYYALVANKLTRPSVLFVGRQPLLGGQYAKAVDLQILHPRTTFEYGRPTWLRSMGRHPAPVPKALRPKTGKRLVQVYLTGEAPDAVPVDQVLLEPGKPLPSLMVPRGPVRFSYQDAS